MHPGYFCERTFLTSAIIGRRSQANVERPMAPVDAEWITGRVRRTGTTEMPSRSSTNMLVRISEIYASQGVLGRRAAPPLHERCPDAASCWRDIDPAARPSGGKNLGFSGDRAGAIAWPWIGRRYRRGGVVLVGLNLRLEWTESTVAIEYLIADADRAQFHAGRRQSDYRSNFAYRSMCAAAAIIASRDGGVPMSAPSPQSLGAVMDQVARVQLVKCNPNSEVAFRGAPSAQMCRRCPLRFLFQELKVLQPGALVIFGQDAFDAVSEHGGVRWRRNRGYFCRGTFDFADAAPELFWLPHPSGSTWSRGYPTFIRSLRSRPARPVRGTAH
jgi:hypothetical protein